MRPLELAQQRDGAVVVVLGAIQRLRKERIEHLTKRYTNIMRSLIVHSFVLGLTSVGPCRHTTTRERCDTIIDQKSLTVLAVGVCARMNTGQLRPSSYGGREICQTMGIAYDHGRGEIGSSQRAGQLKDSTHRWTEIGDIRTLTDKDKSLNFVGVGKKRKKNG